MPRKKKEEAKSVKIGASTHRRLLILSSMFNTTISDVIDEALNKTFPEIIAETDKLLERGASYRKKANEEQ